MNQSLSRVRARVYDAPRQAANRERLAGLVDKALTVTEDILTTGDPHEQLEAARIILQAWVRVAEMDSPQEPGGDSEQRVTALFDNPPPLLLRELEAWRAKMNAKEGK